jgi:hypothetical protein
MYCDVILRGIPATIRVVSITYSECVSVAVVYLACKAYALHYMMMCGPVWLYSIFPHCLINSTIFGGGGGGGEIIKSPVGVFYFLDKFGLKRI